MGSSEWNLAVDTSRPKRTSTIINLAGAHSAPPTADGWYLETKVSGSRDVKRIRIEKLPFRIGRTATTDLALASRSVSGEHAEDRKSVV